jgi:hypothetical protein
MTQINYSAEAVTARLRQVSELNRICKALKAAGEQAGLGASQFKLRETPPEYRVTLPTTSAPDSPPHPSPVSGK